MFDLAECCRLLCPEPAILICHGTRWLSGSLPPNTSARLAGRFQLCGGKAKNESRQYFLCRNNWPRLPRQTFKTRGE